MPFNLRSIEDAVTQGGQEAQAAVTGACEEIRKTAEDAAKAMAASADAAADRIRHEAETARNGIQDTANDFTEKLESAWGDIRDRLGDELDRLRGLLPWPKDKCIRDFDPAAHGFPFENSFNVSINVPGAGLVTSPDFGLCGGMACAAADFFLADRPVPQTTVPAQGTALYNYLVARQVASLGFMGNQVARFAAWQALPAFGAAGLRRGTAQAFEVTKTRLSNCKPVQLGLIYAKLPDVIWHNHQVLAYKVRDVAGSNNQWEILIYDPNHPVVARSNSPDDASEVVLRVRSAGVDSRIDGNLPGLVCTQIVRHHGNGPERYQNVHGFFVMPYHWMPVPPGL